MSSERDLDKMLAGKREPDGESTPLVEVARQLEGMFDVETPSARRERTVFASAVGVRARRSAARFIAPALAGISILAAVYFAGRAADPGNALYPVRKALQEVDLAPRPAETIESRLASAQTKLQEAESFLIERPRRAQSLATDGLKALGAIELLLDEVAGAERAGYAADVAELQNRALVVLVEASVRAVTDRPGIDDSDGDSSNRGPGGDDNSGPGSGSDDSGGDSSGPGSGSDDSGGGDSSGSGSGSDDSGGDSSGSGSGSGSGDSSGSGSGNG